MRFSQQFIDDLRRQADIVRIINDYVTLKKRGSNWVACCPFHQEKTPSFSVNPSKDIFYCFGCGKGGSVFNFVMETDHLSFPEAIKTVAAKTGVPLPQMEGDEKHETRRRDAEDVIALNTKALEWWESQLEAEEPETRSARSYLDNRGITAETRKRFRLGYAPDRWDALLGWLQKQGANREQIEKSGLVVKKETGGFYDRFRGRLIFPVFDVQGKPVAFGGRTPDPAGEPKYLNSPETAAYTKGRHLYGLNQTRDAIRKKKYAILVEGYLDLLIAFQYGVTNVVASLGTALTGEQARLLSRFARRVVVNYDGDRAGINAAKRAIETLLAEDLDVKVLVLPDDADPDEFIRAHGVEEYQKRRGEALPHIQFILDQAVKERDLLRPADKAAAVEEALPFVRAIRNGIQKREFFDITMNTLRVDERSLRNELWRTVKQGAPPVEGEVKKRIEKSAAKPPTIAEQKLLELLVNDAELRREILPKLEESDYEQLATAAIFRALKKIFAEGLDVSATTLSEETQGDPVAEDIIPLLMMSEPARDEGEAIDDTLAVAERCFSALRLMSVDRRLQQLVRDVAAAERAGNEALRDSLALEQLDLTRRRAEFLPRTA